MSSTQATVLAASIAAVAAVILAPLMNAWLQRRNARRAGHEPAVAGARLIEREIEVVGQQAEKAFGENLEVDLATEAWDSHRAAVAARLSREELLVLDRFYAIVKAGSYPGVVALKSMALQAIGWLAEGSRNVVKHRKTERSLAPRNMDAMCECGHIFGHHGWRAVRRRLRIRDRGAKYKDVGFECHRCDCTRFRGSERLDYV